MTTRIHVFGASGSGTTTLAEALSGVLHCRHFDTDRYYWLDTDPPFQAVRERGERQSLLEQDLSRTAAWVLSGSLCGWGDFTIPLFDLAVFLLLPAEVRMERLEQRERARHGPGIEAPDHPGHAQHRAFLAWASAYDTGGPDMRSRACHEAWMETLPCPLVRIEGDLTLDQKVARVLDRLGPATAP